MTKEEMKSEIRFPVLAPKAITFERIEDEKPVPEAWIICFCNDQKYPGPALYKWQKDNNPEIGAWAYIDIEASTGLCRYIEDPQFSDDKLILIREEKYKDFIVES